MNFNRSKLLSRRLPLLLAALLLAGALVFLFVKVGRKNPADRLVVDMSLPIEKKQDEINRILMPYAGGARERVQVRFVWKAGNMSYSDALYFSPEEFAKLSPEDLDKMKMERMANWANAVNEQSRK